MKHAAQKLRDLEAQDYAEEHATIVEDEIRNLAAGLEKDGHRRGKHKWRPSVSLFGSEVVAENRYAADEWQAMFWARIETILANSRQVPPLPWVALLFEKGEFQGVPSVMRIPDSILAPLETLRDNIHIHLEGGPYSLKDMQATMHKHRDELHGYHSSFDLHLEFLDNHANSVLERKALHLCAGVIIQVAHQ